jgi:hypothetical protein
MPAATTFTSPHPSSPWTTLPSFTSSQAKYTFSPDAFSDFDSPSNDMPMLFYKPTVVPAAPVDYFSFRPHGIRSPYLPEDYDSPVEGEGSAYDDDDSASESSTLSTSGTLVDEDEEHSFSLGPVFEEDGDVESGLSSPIHIELVSSFPAPPTLSRSRSSSPSGSSSSEPRTPSVTVTVPSAPVSPRKRHSTVFAAKQGTRRQSSLEAVSFARWQEEKVHVDTPFPAEGEQEETWFSWRRE